MNIREFFQFIGGLGIIAMFIMCIALIWVEDTNTVFKLMGSDAILILFCYVGNSANK